MVKSAERPSANLPPVGFVYSRESGWQPAGGPTSTSLATALEIARRAALSGPVEPIKGAEPATDTEPLLEMAKALMYSRHQSTDPKTSDYSENLKRALTEASKP